MFPSEKSHTVAAGSGMLQPVTPADTPHALAHSEPAAATPPPDRATLGLAWLDRRAATSLVTGPTDDLAAWTRNSAASLCGLDRNEARARLLGRSVAVAAAQMRELEVLLGEALRKRDFDAVDMINRSIVASTRRFARLLAEHRSECSAERRAVVIGAAYAEKVVVKAGR